MTICSTGLLPHGPTTGEILGPWVEDSGKSENIEAGKQDENNENPVRSTNLSNCMQCGPFSWNHAMFCDYV